MAGIQPSHRHRTFTRKKQAACPSVPACTSGCGCIGPRTGWESGYAGQCALGNMPPSPDGRLRGRLRGICRARAREQFTGAMDRMFDGRRASVFARTLLHARFRAVVNTVVSVARAVWNRIFFWAGCPPLSMLKALVSLLSLLSCNGGKE